MLLPETVDGERHADRHVEREQRRAVAERAGRRIAAELRGRNGQTTDVASGSIPLECLRELGSGKGYSIGGEAKSLELTSTYVINKHGEHEGDVGYILLAKPLVLRLEEGAGVLYEYTLSGKVKGYFSGEEALGGTESSVIEVGEAPMKATSKSAKSCPKTKLAAFDASAGASPLEYELVEVI